MRPSLFAAALLCAASLPRSFAVATALPLERIANFRPVCPSLPGIYRSAELERSTAADAAYLLDGARIRTVIDLRNVDEIERAHARSSDFGRALCRAFDEGRSVGFGSVASEGSGQLRRFHVPLLEDTDMFFDEVAARMSPARKAQGALLQTFDTAKYNQLLYDEVARGKQTLLYTAMLATSTRWRSALSLAADRSGGAVLIHCAQGKDRTGMLAALLQHAAGSEQTEIVDSYAASEALLQAATEADPARRRDPTKDASSGVDWSALRGSPPEAMAETFTWIRQQHGSIDGFLESVGCGEEWRQTLLRSGQPPM